MRSGLIVGGVLGLGTALTFGAALLAATLFPNGDLIVAGGGTWAGNRLGIAVGNVLTGPGPVSVALPARGGVAEPEQGPATPVPALP